MANAKEELSTINIEQIMDEIRAQAKEQPAYEPGPVFDSTPTAAERNGSALWNTGRKVKAVLKKIFGKFVRIFVAIGLFIKYQAVNGKNVILDTAAKMNDMNSYVYGPLEERLASLEEENKALRAELDALKEKKN